MIKPESIRHSKKRPGIHEEKLIEPISIFFQNRDYHVVPHSRLNVAWGPIISDIDIILLKDDQMGCVEVKSKKDHIKRAAKQIDRIKDYVDFAWVAAEQKSITMTDKKIGLITISKGELSVHREPIEFTNQPTLDTIQSLRKKCLLKFLTENDQRHFLYKYDLAKYIFENKLNLFTRELIKAIVTCEEKCETNCPIIN